MADVSTFLILFDNLLKTIGLIREGKLRHNDKIDEALKLTMDALRETRVYANKLRNGKRRDINKEHNIAELWSQASIPLRYIDKDLANKCFIKSEYWLEPETWTQARVESEGIALDTIYNKISEIFHNE